MEKRHEEKRDVNVQSIIDHKLDTIETSFGVKILLALESGSRAWDFASKDSDFDVRFIYARPVNDYLRLERLKDVIELPVHSEGGHVLDINGWDVQKALRLAHASNPVLFEWFSSPIVYRAGQGIEPFKTLLPAYFSPKKSVHHYTSMARRTYKAYFGGVEVSLKKYFYVLRPVFAALYVAREGRVAPMRFGDLLQAECPAPLLPAVEDLLERKREGVELGVGPRITPIDRYIDEILPALDKLASTLEEAAAQEDWQPLNSAFLKIVGIA